MNEYKVTFKFIDGTEFTIQVDSNDDLKDFTTKFNEQFQDKRADYVNFIGEEPFTMVNKNNILFYTIETKSCRVDKINKLMEE